MIALDTNVLARYYLNDDKAQAAKAAALFAAEDIFVPRTVLLEFEWVMRGVARVSPTDIANSIAHLLGLPNVRVEDESMVRAAVAALRRGMDFADALHLAACPEVDRFVTFDERLVRRGRRSFDRPEVTVLGGSA